MTAEACALEQFILLVGAIIWMCGFSFMRRRKLLAAWCTGVLGGLCLLFFALLLLDPYLFRIWPDRRDLRRHRETVASRVLNAGGWAALEGETKKLLEEFPYGGNFGGSSEYPVLAALQARRIEIWPAEQGGNYVLINFFGSHATGGRGIPYYSLLITTNSLDSMSSFPSFRDGRLPPMPNVTNFIYEVL